MADRHRDLLHFATISLAWMNRVAKTQRDTLQPIRLINKNAHATCTPGKVSRATYIMYNWSSRSLRCVAIAALCALCTIALTTPALADVDTAILYPELKPPYNAVIESIIEGVKSTRKIEKIPISDNINPKLLLADFKRKNVGNVVVLGRSGQSLAQGLSSELNVINAAVLAAPDSSPSNIITVSMIPDPSAIFQTLRSINPAVDHVFVVYASDTGQWQIDQAKRETLALGISLYPKRVANVKEAATAYQEILDQGLGESDGIWLLHDNSVTDPALLERLLDDSWKQGFTLFSSNVSHVKRGVLFAIYPDNYQMGVQIGRLLQTPLTTRQRGIKKTYTVDHFDIAVNETAAKHIGLQFTKSQRDRFGVRFPADN